MHDTSRLPRVPFPPLSFDGALGRQIVELYTWVVREGIRGAAADALFDSLCQRFVIAGVPLWRAFAGMPTLHPQWGGYSYTWRRDLNAIEPGQFGRGYEYEQILQNSPFGHLIRQMENSAEEEDPLAVPASASSWTRGQARFSYPQGPRRRRRFRLFRGGRPIRRGRGPLPRHWHRLFLRHRPSRGIQRR